MGVIQSNALKSFPKCISKSTSDYSEVFHVTKTVPKKLCVMSESILNFTSDLCKIFELHEELKENYVCSTLSAHIVLTMVAYGADRNTAVEMRNVLHISDEPEFLENYQKLLDILNTKAKTDADHNSDREFEQQVNKVSESKDISKEERSEYFQNLYDSQYMEEKPPSIVTLANKIYITDNCKVKEEYENILKTYFRSKSESVNFAESSKTTGIINAWCDESTNGKITKIIEPNDIDGETVLILMNAVYFKGNWVEEFETAIPKTFYLNKLNKIEVPTMYLDRALLYAKLPELNAQAVRLHFEGENYMEIIVPNEIDGLMNIQRNLNKIDQTEFEYVNVHLWLPKFELESKIEFNKHLMKLGMVDAFGGLADFNKMCDAAVFIKKVLQKAYIKVDEKGCEAAAVTLAEMCQISADMLENPKYITVKVNRPFLFRIMDARFKVPLFIGSVVNPALTTG